GDGAIDDARSEFLNAHELAHHWWGDDLTCASWEEIWLNEGFASYSEVLWAEHRGGEPLAAEYRAAQLDAYRRWHETTTLVDPAFLWGGTVYDKGSLVLHT